MADLARALEDLTKAVAQQPQDLRLTAKTGPGLPRAVLGLLQDGAMAAQVVTTRAWGLFDPDGIKKVSGFGLIKAIQDSRFKIQANPNPNPNWAHQGDSSRGGEEPVDRNGVRGAFGSDQA